MPWFVLVLIVAFLTACQDLFSKKSLQALDPLVVTLWLATIAAAVLGLVVWIQGVPVLQPHFWWILLVNGSLNSLAFWVYNCALKRGDLSLTAPIVAFSPLFFFITSPLIVGEFPTRSDLLGCGLVVAGSYGLNWEARRQGVWAPLLALWTQPASRLMLGVALIWSVTANLDKAGVLRSSPIFWVFAVYAYIALALGGLLLGQTLHRRCQARPSQGRSASPPAVTAPSPGLPAGASPSPVPAAIALPSPCDPAPPSSPTPPRWPYLLAMGLCAALAVSVQMYALTLTLVVRVIAVKRLSTLMGVVLGVVFLGEGGLRNRLVGAAVMVMGVAVLLH